VQLILFLPVKIIDESMLVLFYCCFVVLAYLHFALCIIQDFTAYNGIPCFGVTLWDEEEIERRRKTRGIVLPKDEKKDN